MARKKKAVAPVETFEPIFSTTLNRLDAIEAKLYGKGSKNLSFNERYRIQTVRDRCLEIVKEMFLKRNVEAGVTKRLRDGYIYINDIKAEEFLPVDAEGWFTTDVNFDVMFAPDEITNYINGLWKRVCNEIESHNYKLNF